MSVRTGAQLFRRIANRKIVSSIERKARVQISYYTARRAISTSRQSRQEQAATTAQQTERPLTKNDVASTPHSLTDGLLDPPPVLDENEKQVDWTRSFHGLSSEPFSSEQAAILQQELDPNDVEVKPDGIVYLPEIKYRRILNKAFGPGGWGLAPRGETLVTGKLVTREYAMVVGGRLVSLARGEQQYFDADGIPTATEGCKSNALMRCCKDLGIASELWDPRFIRSFLKTHAKEMLVEHQVTKKRRKHWMRKDDVIRYPFKEIPIPTAASTQSPAKPASKAPVR